MMTVYHSNTTIEDTDTRLLNNSFDDNVSCTSDGYLFKMRSYRTWVFHTGAATTVLVIIFNSMVVRAFKGKGVLSSSMVPLIILAFCDMFASIFMFWPNEIGFLFDFFVLDESKETDIFLQIGKIEYPFCIFAQISYFLGYVFHSSSLLVTSLVAVQKAFVIRFPLWSKVHLMRSKILMISGLFLILLAICINISLALYTVYPSSDSSWCCRSNNGIKEWNAKGQTHIILVSYIVCFILLITSTIYIAFSLTCRRKRRDSKFIRKRHHRSAIIVVAVACFCLITEIIPFFCRSSFFLNRLCTTDIRQFELLILQFGFAVNFMIYIIMSEKLRSKIVFCFHGRNVDQTRFLSQMTSWSSINP